MDVTLRSVVSVINDRIDQFRALEGRRVSLALVAVGVVAAAGMAACGSSSTPKAASSGSSTTSGTGGSVAPGSSPGAMFSAAAVPGLGTVVVDGRGHTVYRLTSASQKNVPCEDATGCTRAWPDLPLPPGTSAATAGAGLQASLLGTTKSNSGETYPTYAGWVLYEFAGDSGPAQAGGQGISSFGGTWSAITPTGTAATPATPATTGGSGGGGSGGY
jgi:hypothetical protein